VNVWDEIIGKLDLALSLSEGFVGGLAGYLGAVRGLDAQPLPAGSRLPRGMTLSEPGVPETPPDPEAAERHFLHLTHGDRGAARHFRDSLESIRDTVDDPQLTTLVEDILAGRTPPRALVSSAAFNRAVAPRLAQVSERLNRLDPAQRAQLVEQGRRELAELGEKDEDEAT